MAIGSCKIRRMIECGYQQRSRAEKRRDRWFLRSYEGQQIVMHGGQDDGFLSTVVLLPIRKVGVAVMINTDQAAMGKIHGKL